MFDQAAHQVRVEHARRAQQRRREQADDFIVDVHRPIVRSTARCASKPQRATLSSTGHRRLPARSPRAPRACVTAKSHCWAVMRPFELRGTARSTNPTTGAVAMKWRFGRNQIALAAIAAIGVGGTVPTVSLAGGKDNRDRKSAGTYVT